MMKTRGEKLLELQEVENDLRDKIAAFKAVKKELELTSPVRVAKRRLDDARTTESEVRAQQQDLNLEWQGVIEKANREEKRLYSGEVTNPRELEALQMDVEHLARRRKSLEEQALELIEEVDHLSKQSEEAKEAYESVAEESRERQEQLTAYHKALRSEIAKQRKHRERALEEIDAGDLDQYRYVQRLKNDTHAVALLQDGICSACHIEVSAAKRDMVERTNRSALSTCGNCGRILVT